MKFFRNHLFFMVILSGVVAGCGEKSADRRNSLSTTATSLSHPSPQSVSLTGKRREDQSGQEKQDFASTEDLARAVVAALNAGDEGGMYQVIVSKEAYTQDLWPAFPASDPRLNFTGEFAWGNLYRKCVAGIQRGVSRYGGKNLTFAGIRFDQPTETYEGFRLHRGTVVTVREPGGSELELRFLGSVVERGGRFQLLSYDD